MRKSALVAALCIFVPLCGLYVPALAQEAIFSQSRPFRGVVRRDMAQNVAQAAAELDALHQAMRLLAQEPALQFANASGKGAAQTLPDLAGLARMLYATRVVAEGIKGFPPAMEAVVHVALSAPDGALRDALITALNKPESVELYAQAVKRLESLVVRYDKDFPPLLPLPPEAGGKKIELFTLQNTVKALDAVRAYLALLPERSPIWPNPQEMLAKLQRILEQDPTSPLVLTALAEVHLQLDHPAEALEHAVSAIRLDPDIPAAHDAKGTALLRQRLPALAAGAFSDAITLSPHNAELYAHRAAALLVQEEIPAMCEDFRSACALGDCTGYHWARTSGKCPPDEKDEKEDKDEKDQTDGKKDAPAPSEALDKIPQGDPPIGAHDEPQPQPEAPTPAPTPTPWQNPI